MDGSGELLSGVSGVADIASEGVGEIALRAADEVAAEGVRLDEAPASLLILSRFPEALPQSLAEGRGVQTKQLSRLLPVPPGRFQSLEVVLPLDLVQQGFEIQPVGRKIS